ncbi:MAG TPA: site-2 protease family protein [Gemmatimonadaceae bacterium]|nr:site-2 protease family protein [Gemmatimonadaceae bacterium]
MGSFQTFILAFPALLFAMIAHEYAHGYAALKQGDPTAYQLGRLTWNPIKHIDPFMSILLPLVMLLAHGPIIGGAKPVPVNPRNYRNFKRGDIIVSLAGIATNIAIAIITVPVLVILGLIVQAVPATAGVVAILQAMLVWGVLINLFLAMFNLLPIPPLDGSHVLKYLLPPAWAIEYQKIGQYGIIILIALLYVGVRLLDAWLKPAFIGYGLLLQPIAHYIVPSQFLPGMSG